MFKSYNSIAQAELERNLLKEHGIACWVQKRGLDFPGSMGDSYGADLFVAKEDVERVRVILDEFNEEAK